MNNYEAAIQDSSGQQVALSSNASHGRPIAKTSLFVIRKIQRWCGDHRAIGFPTSTALHVPHYSAEPDSENLSGFFAACIFSSPETHIYCKMQMI